jgi:hypothetical protein
MLNDFHAGDRGADPERALLHGDLAQLGDFLDVNQQLGLDQVGFHLHDDVGAAGEDPARTGRPHEQRDGVVKRQRRLVFQ